MARRYVSDARANQLALLPSLMEGTPIVSALLITDLLAKREAEPVVVPPAPTPRVPDLSGMSAVQAKDALLQARLSMVEQDIPSDTVVKTYVIQQVPAAGSPIDPQNPNVIVYVSSGPLTTVGQAGSGTVVSVQQEPVGAVLPRMTSPIDQDVPAPVRSGRRARVDALA
jgi:hypothetical protein